MARIRSIKPDFFRHEALQDLEAANPGKYPMLVFAGLWTQCDRAGRFEWKPRTLKLDLLPFLEFDIGATLELLVEGEFIERYEVNGRQYGMVCEWARHQIPGRDEPESDIPDPSGERTTYIRPPNGTVRAKIYDRDGYRCKYCSMDLRNSPRMICLDHVIPYSSAGTNGERNLVTSCKKCNAAKGARTPAEAGVEWPSGFGEAYVDGRPTLVNGVLTGGGQPPDKEGVRVGEIGKVGVVSGSAPDAAALGRERRKQAAEIIAFLNAKAGRNFDVNGANADHVVARLKDGESQDDCRAVIALKCRQWKGDEKMAMYLRPETLFSRTKFASYKGELAVMEGDRS